MTPIEQKALDHLEKHYGRKRAKQMMEDTRIVVRLMDNLHAEHRRANAKDRPCG